MSNFNIKLSVENIVIIAVLVAIASIGRIAFTSIPSIQLTSFIIIMTGIVFGKKTGLITGILVPIVTDLLIGGINLWTIFQIIGWGLMGLSAGILSNQLKEPTVLGYILRGIFGFIWGFIFGWINDIYFMAFVPLTLNSFISLCVLGFPFDLPHAIVNLVALTLFFEIFRRIFTRVKEKYLNNELSNAKDIDISDKE
jgi:energy-coupling factor transport system substrate-specific component